MSPVGIYFMLDPAFDSSRVGRGLRPHGPAGRRPGAGATTAYWIAAKIIPGSPGI